MGERRERSNVSRTSRFVATILGALALFECQATRISVVDCASSADCGPGFSCDENHDCVANGGTAGDAGDAGATGGMNQGGASSGGSGRGGSSVAGGAGNSAGGSQGGSEGGEGGACEADDGGSAGSDGNVATDLREYCVGCTRTPIRGLEGQVASWEPVSAVLVTAGVGFAGSEGSWLDFLVAPNHRFYLLGEAGERYGIYGPAMQHNAPYDDEIYDLSISKRVTVKQAFTSADFHAPSGIGIVLVVAPRANAPVGSSTDYQCGPIIPNAIFPFNIDFDAYRNGTRYLSAYDSIYPGYDNFTDEFTGEPKPIDADGPSHFILSFGQNDSFGMPQADGDYEAVIHIIDATGLGWTARIPFTVAP